MIAELYDFNNHAYRRFVESIKVGEKQLRKAVDESVRG